MSDQQNHTPESIIAHLEAQLPTGSQLHDEIMEEIEPDLTTANIPLLPKKYANESTEERAERVQRYKDAVQKYDAEMEKLLSEIDAQADAYRDEVEETSLRHDADSLSNLENTLSDTNT